MAGLYGYAVETVITNLDIGSIPFVMLFYRQSATVASFLGCYNWALFFVCRFVILLALFV